MAFMVPSRKVLSVLAIARVVNDLEHYSWDFACFLCLPAFNCHDTMQGKDCKRGNAYFGSGFQQFQSMVLDSIVSGAMVRGASREGSV